ncbi:hypothetical protein D0868_16108 [Hortaea werneckii]|uniref:Uncharacterized protein n=1 Tax=Hortaea werneckii TaxID=91943 RepID=A0A3M6WQ65_HORWE|nr:hypothetical protein D0868_16108 [Hortaea werneckii]
MAATNSSVAGRRRSKRRRLRLRRWRSCRSRPPCMRTILPAIVRTTLAWPSSGTTCCGRSSARPGGRKSGIGCRGRWKGIRTSGLWSGKGGVAMSGGSGNGSAQLA